MICECCNKVIITDIKYWYEEKFFVKGSDRQLPFCGPVCSLKWKMNKD
jgi:hypothetical protein